jgi:hypothetical protein
MGEKFKQLNKLSQTVLQVFLMCLEGAMIIDGFENEFLFLDLSNFRDQNVNSQAP